MSKLPHDLRMMIDKLCQKGDQFAQIDQPDDALDQYEAAWELLPSPKNQWPAATWILLAAGDVYFEQRNFVVAEQTLHEALNFPDGETNPFIWLRLGQCRFELGDLNGAAMAFEQALKIGGDEISQFSQDATRYHAGTFSQRHQTFSKTVVVASERVT